MSQIKAEETVRKLKSWIAERDRLNDFGEYGNGQKVNRADLIDEHVLKRSQLSANGNPVLRQLLSEAEDRWYGTAPVESIESHKDARESSEALSRHVSGDVNRLQKGLAEAQAELFPLKAEIASLKAENEDLRNDLGILKVREAALTESYRGLPGWD